MIEKYFGEWHVSETDITLSGFLEINNDTKEYILNLYSDKPLQLGPIVAQLENYIISVRYNTGTSYNSKSPNKKTMKTSSYIEIQFKKYL
ncbi:hypothetical protein F9802_18950 [Bacillus aerolatus]|uniref:Uncharacterized protein n=1 Tax=Bacillus aerolatus TaxID=2653354 RepID=A0A6I1FQT5_9BACI|nr:hypothetical protein [Bacillus aerolatus]KAB7704105.1 hypothetical protein F9802_18950 [Bacillus aerolatus]